MTDFYNELKEGYLTVSWDRANENEDGARNRINCVGKQKIISIFECEYVGVKHLIELYFSAESFG